MNLDEKEMSEEEILSLLEKQIIGVTEEEKELKSVVAITPHPNNENFKLFAVFNDFADEELLFKIEDDINNWFSSLNDSIYLNIDRIYGEYLNKLVNIKEKLEEQEFALGSFSSAIVGENKTIISKVGNTNIYRYSNGSIDDLSVKGLLKILSNDNFDSLVLMSKGEYGNILDNRIKIVSKNVTKEELVERLFESKAN